MKTFLYILAGLAIAFVMGLAAFALYAWDKATREKGKAQTAAATAARWQKKPDEQQQPDEVKLQQETKPIVNDEIKA